MNLGGTVELGDVAASMVDAKHSSGAQDKDGTHYVGVAAGYVLNIANGPVLYHAGDTHVFGDMRLIGELYHPEVAMLPIGGHFTMGPKEAALAARYLGSEDHSPASFRHLSAPEGYARTTRSIARWRGGSHFMEARRQHLSHGRGGDDFLRLSIRDSLRTPIFDGLI